MTTPAKCSTCGHKKNTAVSKFVSFILTLGGLVAQSWAFFLVHPLPQRIWFASMVGLVVLFGIVKAIATED